MICVLHICMIEVNIICGEESTVQGLLSLSTSVHCHSFPLVCFIWVSGGMECLE